VLTPAPKHALDGEKQPIAAIYSEPAANTPCIGVVAQGVAFLRIRAGASEQTAELGYLVEGDRLVIDDFENGGAILWAHHERGWSAVSVNKEIYINTTCEGR